MKKLLYLSDLYNFYVTQNKNVKFSSKNDDTTIVVHIDEPFTYEKNEENDLLMYTPIRLCHTLSNKNRSHISEKSMKDAIPSAYNMPILSYIYKDDNDEYQFAGHEFFVNEDDELEYEEQPTGVIPESAGLKLVKYDGDDRLYLEGMGIIWRTYSKASDIIEREKELSVSVELVVDELSFDSKTKELVIDKFRFSGVTILGKDRNTGDDIMPGMENSMISIGDFSEKNNSIFSSNDKVIELLSALNEKIDNLNINDKNLGKEEETLKKEFEENLEAEVEETPTEVFEDDPKKKKKVEDDDTTVIEPDEDDEPTDDDLEGGDNSGDDPTDSGANPEPQANSEETPTEEPTQDDAQESGDEDESGDPEDVSYYSVKFSVDHGDVHKETFATLSEKLGALSDLVNATYGETDGTWYSVDADEEKKLVYMHDWWFDKHYRQSYSVKKDIFSLVGDRVETYARYLTQDEINAFEQMKANYSSIETELAQYKAEPEKEAVLAEECYSQIKDTDAYKALAEKDAHFSMSVDEVRAELDKQLLEYAKGHEIKFSSNESEKKQVGMKLFGNPSKKAAKSSSRYGGIFSK